MWKGALSESASNKNTFTAYPRCCLQDPRSATDPSHEQNPRTAESIKHIYLFIQHRKYLPAKFSKHKLPTLITIAPFSSNPPPSLYTSAFVTFRPWIQSSSPRRQRPIHAARRRRRSHAASASASWRRGRSRLRRGGWRVLCRGSG